MRMKAKRISLAACLFLFMFVVIGNGLRLNPAGAFLAAATGTPLLIYVFNQRSAETTAHRRTGQLLRGAIRADGHDQGPGDRSAGWEDQSASGQYFGSRLRVSNKR
jgi:hypothetical protein